MGIENLATGLETPKTDLNVSDDVNGSDFSALIDGALAEFPKNEENNESEILVVDPIDNFLTDDLAASSKDNLPLVFNGEQVKSDETEKPTFLDNVIQYGEEIADNPVFDYIINKDGTAVSQTNDKIANLTTDVVNSISNITGETINDAIRDFPQSSANAIFSLPGAISDANANFQEGLEEAENTDTVGEYYAEQTKLAIPFVIGAMIENSPGGRAVKAVDGAIVDLDKINDELGSLNKQRSELLEKYNEDKLNSGISAGEDKIDELNKRLLSGEKLDPAEKEIIKLEIENIEDTLGQTRKSLIEKSRAINDLNVKIRENNNIVYQDKIANRKEETPIDNDAPIIPNNGVQKVNFEEQIAERYEQGIADIKYKRADIYNRRNSIIEEKNNIQNSYKPIDENTYITDASAAEFADYQKKLNEVNKKLSDVEKELGVVKREEIELQKNTAGEFAKLNGYSDADFEALKEQIDPEFNEAEPGIFGDLYLKGKQIKTKEEKLKILENERSELFENAKYDSDGYPILTDEMKSLNEEIAYVKGDISTLTAQRNLLDEKYYFPGSDAKFNRDIDIERQEAGFPDMSQDEYLKIKGQAASGVGTDGLDGLIKKYPNATEVILDQRAKHLGSDADLNFKEYNVQKRIEVYNIRKGLQGDDFVEPTGKNSIESLRKELAEIDRQIDLRDTPPSLADKFLSLLGFGNKNNSVIAPLAAGAGAGALMLGNNDLNAADNSQIFGNQIFPDFDLSEYSFYDWDKPANENTGPLLYGPPPPPSFDLGAEYDAPSFDFGAGFDISSFDISLNDNNIHENQMNSIFGNDDEEW